ncbi:MAG: GTP cyclohydrolase I FolE2 [Myxococcales bacterium]|nr:GTP cyclohydrolase I FolE2 [Myxococcales bacterium]
MKHDKIESASSLPDHASEYDGRQLPIDRVGIRGLKYPITVLDKDHRTQHTVAELGLFVGLPARFKGTHMSRFIEVLNTVRGELTIRNLPMILSQIQHRLNSEDAFLEASFPYFIEKEAPVSKAKSLMEYACYFTASAKGEQTAFKLGVQVPVKSLCPCSKAISERGAHNQRSVVDVQVASSGFLWIEDVVNAVEACASSPVYALLKRSDEKFVTEKAYDNPKFVEDLVRDVVIAIRALDSVTYVKVSAENFESIHNHEAYAEIEWSTDVGQQTQGVLDVVSPTKRTRFSFGRWLKQQRTERHLSQSELAIQLGVTSSFLSRIESDERQPSAEHLELMATILGLSTETVMLRAGVVPDTILQLVQENPERLKQLYSANSMS